MNELTENVEILEVCGPVSDSSSIDTNSDRIDMSGWDGVVFIVPVTNSTITGDANLTVEGNTIDSDSGMTALTGAEASATSAVTDDLNDQLLIVDVYKPLKRYLQGVLTSAHANIAFGNMIAIKYRGRKAPITDDDTVLDRVTVVGV